MANYEFAAFHQIAKPAQELAMLTPLPPIPFTATVPAPLGVNPSTLPCLFRPPFDWGREAVGLAMALSLVLIPRPCRVFFGRPSMWGREAVGLGFFAI
jgi:hypothetical protein